MVFRGPLPCRGLTQELPCRTRTVLIESLKWWEENPQPFTLEFFLPLKTVYTALPSSAARWDGPASLDHISSPVSIPKSSVFLPKPTWQGFSQQQPQTFLFIVFMLLWQHKIDEFIWTYGSRWVRVHHGGRSCQQAAGVVAGEGCWELISYVLYINTESKVSIWGILKFPENLPQWHTSSSKIAPPKPAQIALGPSV